MAQIPAIQGWFTEGAEPALIGSRCTECHTYFFPRETHFCKNPACGSESFEDVELSRTGRIWSYTNGCYQPPAPYVSPDPFEPYTIIAAELAEEKIIVLGQASAGVTVDDLKLGMEVELVVEPLFRDEEGDHTVWKWRPVR